MEERKSIDVDGTETCYYERGKGPPMVLFHGGNLGSAELADSALDWGLNFAALARRHHVFAIDKIGQGFTDIPKSDSDYTMAATVRHALATLDALGLKDVDLVGHSRGGYLVCRMTLERPDLVRTCTIVDSGTGSPGPSLTEKVMQGLPEPLLGPDAQRECLVRYSYGTGHITDDWLAALVEIAALRQYREATAKMNDAGLRHSQFMPALERDKEEMFGWIRDRGMGRPTQLIWGYNDPTAPLDSGRALFDMIAATEPRAQFHVLNRAGHFSYREQPEAFNALIEGLTGAAG